MVKQYKSFKDFYPFYLSQHRHPVCRALHLFGTLAVLSVFLLTLWTKQWPLLLLLPFLGYGPAWIGHFFFEKNKPATFEYPFYSFIGDWVMLKDSLLGSFKHTPPS